MSKLVSVFVMISVLAQPHAALFRHSRELAGHADTVNAGAFSPDGQLLATSALMLATSVTARAADQPQKLTVRPQERLLLGEDAGHGRVYDLAFSPARDSFVCAFAMKQAVQIWDLSEKPRVIMTLTPARPTNFADISLGRLPHPIAFSTDSARLAAGYFEGVQIWDFARRSLSFAIPTDWFPEAIRFSPADDTVIIGCSYRGMYTIQGDFPNKIEIWPRSEYERRPVADPTRLRYSRFGPRRAGAEFNPQEEKDVCFLAVAPDGKRLFSGCGPVVSDLADDYVRGSSVTEWDVATGSRIQNIRYVEGPILRFRLSPNGQILYTCGHNVLSWDARKPARQIRRFDALEHRAISLAISPDGAVLAAGDRDGTVTLCTTDSATRLATLSHDAGPVYGLAFSSNSRRLVAAGEKGVANIWLLRPAP